MTPVFTQLAFLVLGDEESCKLKVAAYSNQALCYQKTNEHFEAKQAVSTIYIFILVRILMLKLWNSVMKPWSWNLIILKPCTAVVNAM